MDAIGGGVSQVATTFYNAAFFAGLELIAHTPHEFYISRYPMGREATVSWGGPELIFRNDWPAGILVKVIAGDTFITVQFYSSKLGRRVETETGEPYAYTSATTVRVYNPSLPPGTETTIQSGGITGFTVGYTRRVYRGDELTRDEDFLVRYLPENSIVEYGPALPAGGASGESGGGSSSAGDSEAAMRAPLTGTTTQQPARKAARRSLPRRPRADPAAKNLRRRRNTYTPAGYGYDEPMAAAYPARVDLEIEGMSCASCAVRVEQRLNDLGGVRASVNFGTEKAAVQFDPAVVRLADLLGAVQETGYGASLPGEATIPERDRLRPALLRLGASVALTVPLAVIAMVPAAQFDGWEWVALALAAPVVLVAGWPFHRAAALNARHRVATMDTLVSLGTLATLVWSIVALVAYDGADTYFEVGAVITTLILLGRFLEARARRRSGSAVRALLGARAPGGPGHSERR